MSIRMRKPETVRLELSQGDWIVVKKHLTAGETRRMFAGMLREETQGIDAVKVWQSKVLAYLLGWTFQDADGKALVIEDQPERVVASILDNLDADAYSEVLKAIEQHMSEMEKERVAEKNAPAIVSELSLVSR